jgi:hypothetical protein
LSNVPNFGVPTPAYESESRQLVYHKTIALPLTGSHPLVALNPPVPHPGLCPFVMSLNASAN